MRTSVSRKGQTIALAQFVTRRKSVCGVAKAAKTRAKNKRANTPKASGTAARRGIIAQSRPIRSSGSSTTACVPSFHGFAADAP